MKQLKFIPLQLTLSLILGILTGYFFSISVGVVSIFLLVFVFLLIVVYAIENQKLTPVITYTTVTIILFYVIGIAAITFQNDLNKKDHYSALNFDQYDTTSVVLTIDSQLRPGLFNHKFESRILQLNDRKVHGKILLNISKDGFEPAISIGDKILVRGKITEVSGPKNPYQFNYKKYMERQQIYHQLTITNKEYLVLSSSKTHLNSLADSFRKRVNRSLEKVGFKDNELSIINALLLGQRQEVSKELIEDYTNAGAIHILAISGLHIGIILLIINFLLKPLKYVKNGKMIKLILSILILWSFAFVAGLSPSVVRAVTMFTAIAISIFGKRKSNIYQNLILSMFILLIVNPMYLFEVGFQLSYLAVFFIVWLQPLLYTIWIPKWKVIDYFWQIFTVSLAAQLGVLPLSIYYFHQFPGLFFITNLVIIPVLGLILGFGLLVIFLSLINLVPKFLVIGLQKVIQLMNLFIGWVAEQENYLFQNITFSTLQMISTYFLIIFSFRWIEQKSNSRFKYALVSLLFIQSLFIYEKWSTSLENELIIFNKSKASIVGVRQGANLKLYHSKDHLSNTDNLVKSYITGTNVKAISLVNTIDKRVLINNNILLVDSLGIYQIKSFQPRAILLTQSPKINIERLIKTIDPQKIIADHSNYTSYVNRWRRTCKNYQISFYYTNEKGAYILGK
ncbi:MAG: ComEC family competence protein [Flavobacteriaceae bacterium]|nr:ComEC family competence protein [Flavobacteriaceae bacterium]